MKLLVWNDVNLLFYGIACVFNNNKNYEVSVIHDLTDDLKQIFKNRKKNIFHNEWYFWNEISWENKKPDIEYLKKIEENYKIKIWMDIANERLFDKWNIYYKFSYEQILSIIENECKFFEKVLDKSKPDFLIIKHTDYHRNHLLAELCGAKGIKVFMLMPSLLGKRTIIVDEKLNIHSGSDLQEKFLTNIDNSDQLLEFLKNFSKYDQTKQVIAGGGKIPISKKILITLKWLFSPIPKEDSKRYDYYGVTKTNTLFKRIKLGIIKRSRESFIDKNFSRTITNNKFIYFPLHVDPERTISIDAPYQTNQLEVIMNIVKSMPIDYILYVKEHHNQRYRNWRELSFYKTLIDLPNVELIHHEVNSSEILQKASLVITITGTTGFEGLLYQKPAIALADVSYMKLSSVFRIEKMEELSSIIRKMLDVKVNFNELKEFIETLLKNSFEFNLTNTINDIQSKFQHGGFSMRKDMTIVEIDQYFEQNHLIFHRLYEECEYRMKNH